MYNNSNIPRKLTYQRISLISLACSGFRSLPGRYAPLRARNRSVYYLILQIAIQSGKKLRTFGFQSDVFLTMVCATLASTRVAEHSTVET